MHRGVAVSGGRFAGQVALVTGASSGIGRATALAFGGEGARVVLANRRVDLGQEVAHLVEEAGGQALFVPTDVTRPDQVAHLVAAAVGRWGRLDCAFNNAGGGVRRGTVTQCSEEDWDYTMDSYLKSVWLCMKHELLQMQSQGSGAIVNNASVDGLRGFPQSASYCAAKHGVVGLTRAAALQYARQGIRVNAVCPGWVRTPPVEGYLQRDPAGHDVVLQDEPIGRLGEPEEIAQAVLWLCSGAASFMLGHALPVDGGHTA
ncbi:MAG: SDR family oxidoreductase [Candidatus Latescibacterota bacterium]